MAQALRKLRVEDNLMSKINAGEDNVVTNRVLIADENLAYKDKVTILRDKTGDDIYYSFISYGKGDIKFIHDPATGKVTMTGQQLLKSYNRLYCKIDVSNYDEIYLKFNILGNKNSNFDNAGLDSNYTSTDRKPNITCGLIKVYNPENDTARDLTFDASSAFIYPEDDTNSFYTEIDTKELTGEYYVIITNLETGDFARNPKYDPNTETELPMNGLITVSAPDLVKFTGRIYNRPPTIPENFNVYVNTKSDKFTQAIEDKMANLIDNFKMPTDITKYDVVEGMEARFYWTASIDEDEEKYSATLPAGLSKGDINKDGKFDKADLEMLNKHLAEEDKVLIEDTDSLWAALVMEPEGLEPVEITTTIKDLYTEFLFGTKTIELKNKIESNSWLIDKENNLYYYEILNDKITKDSIITLYNQELYKLQTLDKIVCKDGKFIIYVKCCPTTELNIYYKLNVSKTHSVEEKLETITYKLTINYDNGDSELYYIFPKDKSHLDMRFIQELYEDYKTLYGDAYLEDFLHTFPDKLSSGYILEDNNETAAYAIMASEKYQYDLNLFMFRRYITSAELVAIDELGEESEPAKLINKAILYPNNTKPTPPTNIQITQEGEVLHFSASGATDADINEGNKKDVIRYYYEIRPNKEDYWIPLSTYYNSYFRNVGEYSIGDINQDGKIDLQDETIMYKMVMGSYLTPSRFELDSADLNRDGQVNAADLSMMNAYLNNHISKFENLQIIETDYLINHPSVDRLWYINDDNSGYRYNIPLLQQKNRKPGTSIHIFSKTLYDYGTFLGGKTITAPSLNNDKETYLQADCDFKTIPPSTDFIYCYVEDGKSEVKLFEYPTGDVDITRLVDSCIDRYIDVRARATDRMTYSDESEVFSSIIYMDSLLGVRNVIAALGSSGGSSTKKVWHESATPPENKNIFWIDTDEDEGGLKRWDEGSQTWVPVPVIWS